MTGENPFKLLSEHEIFALREKENSRKVQKDKMGIVEKTRLGQRKNNRKELEREITVENCSKSEVRTIDPYFATQVTKKCHVNRDTATSFIDKKREMFRMQYAAKVKKDEIQRLMDLMDREDQDLTAAERKLEEDAVLFDEFIKVNDKNSVEATKIAEKETRNKLEKISKVKRINSQISQIKNDVSRQNEILKELNYYKTFLDKATPEEVKKKHRDDEDELVLYFDDPKQLLNVFTELEEQNLSLIQNSQETEEAIEEIYKQISAHKESTEEERTFLEGQLERLKDSIQREKESADRFELKIKMFSLNECTQEDQDEILADMHRRVEETYVKTIGPNEAQISTLQMLSNIENFMLKLFDQIENLPHDKYELMEKIREKDRRLKMKEEKQLQQKLHQEERLRKAMERSQAQPKKMVKRPMVFRSKPPSMKRRVKDNVKTTKDEEENAYYFAF